MKGMIAPINLHPFKLEGREKIDGACEVWAFT